MVSCGFFVSMQGLGMTFIGLAVRGFDAFFLYIFRLAADTNLRFFFVFDNNQSNNDKGI